MFFSCFAEAQDTQSASRWTTFFPAGIDVFLGHMLSLVRTHFTFSVFACLVPAVVGQLASMPEYTVRS